MKKTFGVLYALVLILGMAVTSWGDVPPPPVNQNIGIIDRVTDFSGQTQVVNRAFCAQCHPGSLVERHHNLIATRNLDCLFCHTLAPGGGGFTFTDFRECTNCHTTSPHHTTAAAQARNCAACHGSLVDNFNDGHVIPTYPISSVTPKTGGVELPAGSDQFAGGCKACHRGNVAQGLNENNMTHHGTGIGIPVASGGSGGDCAWCHAGSQADMTTFLNIRKCEDCHGIQSLHNIQADTPATANVGTIVPGAESMGYGHIGNNRDCVGCHIGTMLPYASGMESAMPATIASVSQTTLAQDKAATLTLKGETFVNTSGTTVYKPVVELVKGDVVTRLYPTSSSASELEVSVPGLAAGNYELRVVKDEALSNKLTLVVAQPITVSSATVAKDVVTIKGTGFGKAAGSVFNGAAAGRVLSWSDSEISVAMKADTGAEVTVVSATGATDSASLTAGSTGGKTKGGKSGRSRKG